PSFHSSSIGAAIRAPTTNASAMANGAISTHGSHSSARSSQFCLIPVDRICFMADDSRVTNLKQVRMAESPLDTALVRREERGFAATAHLFAAIPLWGLVFLAVLLVWFKERSREVVFHIIQAMVFQ